MGCCGSASAGGSLKGTQPGEANESRQPVDIVKKGAARAGGPVVNGVLPPTQATLAEFIGSDVPAKLVMGHFIMLMGEDQVMGEGTFSICRKAVDLRSGELVAIKTFKDTASVGGDELEEEMVRVKKFSKQVKVLEDLSLPLQKPKDAGLWADLLETVDAEDLFMKIIDYSKAPDGQPGPDKDDGVLYLATELASYSLDDYLYDRKEQNRPLCRRLVEELTRAVLLVCSALHAKGLCHLDLKPENLMIFNSRMKLIDVDGCVPTGSAVAIGDSSVSFSPAFCSPEWARWMTSVEEGEQIAIQPALDVWSVGMTLGQLVTLDVIFEEKYAEFEGPHARTNFLIWLSELQEPYLPKIVRNFDPEFLKVLKACLTCNNRLRPTLASCLSLPFILRAPGGENKVALEDEDTDDLPSPRVTRGQGKFKPDLSTGPPRLQGTSWQLTPGQNGSSPLSWTHCDLWLSSDDNLCFFCREHNDRLVYMDSGELSQAKMAVVGPCIHGVAIELQGSRDRAPKERFTFENAPTAERWIRELRLVKDRSAATTAPAPATLTSSAEAAPVLELRCNDRRTPVPFRHRHEYEPVFRTLLWKHLQSTDPRQRTNWHAREVWIAVNFSLVYYSPQEDGNLIHYPTRLLERASVEAVPSSDVALPWAFRLVLPSMGIVRETPSLFAAVTEEARDHWMQEFRVHQVRRLGLRHLRASLLRNVYSSHQGAASIFADAGATAELSKVKEAVRTCTGVDPDTQEAHAKAAARRASGLAQAAEKTGAPAKAKTKSKAKAKGKSKIADNNDVAKQQASVHAGDGPKVRKEPKERSSLEKKNALPKQA